MSGKKKCIAIITARGGSKRIPNKNIKLFCGKPIIQYSIEAALHAHIFDEVMVSTDSQEIAELSRNLGAGVPFMRSEETSDDYATTSDVLKEVLLKYEKSGIIFENLACIYPTAPFITKEKLCFAMNKLETENVDCVMPVVEYSFPPLRSVEIKENLAYMKFPEYLNSRSQDLSPWYHDCGQYYCANVKRFLDEGKLMMEKVFPVITSELEVQDIDNINDWEIAEIKFNLFLQNRLDKQR